ncbi:hypothetical protein [Streptomyces sp. NPDC037389]|uniref:hypothetical protein n=1 Tax=Streptomyces sp. NPDC037389 TaxID=3155369 RepID=UPI0033ECBF9A
MTETSRPVPVWKRLLFAGAACTLVIGGLNLALNTNLLGPSNLCDGLISEAQAERTLGAVGRLASDSTTSPPAGKLGEFHCKLTQIAKFTGGNEKNLWVDSYQQLGNFPFTVRPRWSYPAKVSFFTGSAIGAVSDTDGWVLLPQSCWSPDKNGPRVHVIEAGVPGHPVARMELARLLVNAANNAARREGCAKKELAAPTTLESPPEITNTSPDAVCGIRGFTAPVTGAAGIGRHVEQSGNFSNPVWTCDLTPKGAQSPYTRFSITRDKTLVSAQAQQISYLNARPPQGWNAQGDRKTGIIASCKDGDTYFSVHMEKRPTRPTEESEVKALFDSFVKAAGNKLGCGRIAP